MRRAGLLLLAVVALMVTALIAASVYLRTARPQIEGDVEVAGLSAPVDVWRDSLGVPHVFAGNEQDLFFTQGWVHAQDRIWQMELFRRIAQGRVSEILGPALVDTDRFLRTIGGWRAALDHERTLGAAPRRWLESYAAGVNAWITGHRGALPPEFVVLRTEPEPWTPAHTLAIEKVMAWDLSAWGTVVSAARAEHVPERARWLQAQWPEWAPTILEHPVLDIPEAAIALLESVSVTRASNAWVIGGSRTQSGRPILANDMHLALRAPAIWYLIALHAPGWDVAGMSLPGTPFVIAGHNTSVAWGFTNAMLDDVDLFVERIDPADSSRYLTPTGSEPFAVLHESIRVRGAADPVRLDLRLTRHGPIVETLEAPAGDDVMAMRWAAHDASRTFEAIPALNRARDAMEVLAAVRRFENPHQNVVYADTAGNFGYAMSGRIPVRGAGMPAPDAPVPGWTGEWDWNGWYPFETHPQVHNPETGYVVTANNRQVAGDAADRISRHWEPPFRAERIRELIHSASRVDADAVHAMQLDVHDKLAARYRTLAIAAARRAGLADRATALEEWNADASIDSRAATFFYVWYDQLRESARASLWEGGDGPLPIDAFNDILERAAFPWSDEAARARFDSAAATAATRADSLAGNREWGDMHSVHAQHALSASALLNRLLGLDVGGAPAPGSATTVNVSQYNRGVYPIRASYGPSQRHVVDLAAVDGEGGFVLTTGQSGLPFDMHYRDQWRMWFEGGLWRIPLDRAAAGSRTVHRLSLRPGS
ncbi:MAG: penicillin acylase family protein [Gemmatimonadetes bacterium]|nr:penicillin acylase family protein [Gemmatimonadota bacterium]